MGELIHELLTDEILRQRLIDSIESMLENYHLPGNIDFEFIPPADRAALNSFMEGLYEDFLPGLR